MNSNIRIATFGGKAINHVKLGLMDLAKLMCSLRASIQNLCRILLYNVNVYGQLQSSGPDATAARSESSVLYYGISPIASILSMKV